MDARELTKKNSEKMPYGALYVPLTDVNEKRKSLLKSLKDSLLMQEEYEKIVEIRKAKAVVLKDIKKGLDSINTDYQEIKRQLPNVKNVLSFTEKEIFELESQIESLKTDIKSEDEEIKALTSMQKTGRYKEPEKKKPVDKKKEKYVSVGNKAPASSMTKVDRIRNNLKVIESKLKGL